MNLALHAAAAALVLLILRRLLSARAAAVAALFFLVHPLQVETVADPAARALAAQTALVLAALLAWLRERAWLAAVLYAAALAAGPQAAVLPVFLLLLAISRREPPTRWHALLAGLATARLALAYAQGGRPSFDYFLTQGVFILRALWLLLVPVALTPEPELAVASPLLAAAAWAAVFALVMLSGRGFRYAREGFWLAAGLLLLIPTCTFFPSPAVDARMALPLFAFAALAGLLLERLRPLALGALFCVYAFLAVEQYRLWLDPPALWLHAARVAPNRLRPKRELARYLPPPQAAELLEDALSLAPHDAALRRQLGAVYRRLGRLAEAAEQERAAAGLEAASYFSGGPGSGSGY